MGKNHRRCFLAFGMSFLLAAVGCGSSISIPALEAPNPDESRKALAASLDAWRDGHRQPGGLINGSPAIGTTDSMRVDRPLISYKIEGGLGVVEKARPFSVSLELDSPHERVTTRYLVFGQDPLWVFQQDDYSRILHWEHKMDPNHPEDIHK